MRYKRTFRKSCTETAVCLHYLILVAVAEVVLMKVFDYSVVFIEQNCIAGAEEPVAKLNMTFITYYSGIVAALCVEACGYCCKAAFILLLRR